LERVAVEEASNWIRAYVPLAAALTAVLIALFQYFTSRPKLRLEMEKLRQEIRALSEDSRANSDNISEIQNLLIDQLPMYSDETVVYDNVTGNLGFDFVGTGGQLYADDKPIPGKGSGSLSFLEKGIINIERDNTDGRYELYLRSYTLGARKTEIIPKDTTEDRPKRFRVSCEARTLSAEHTLRLVMRNRDTGKWLGKSIAHRISGPDWKRIEGHFTVTPLVNAEFRLDDEGVSAVPSTVQIRKFMVTQRTSE